MSTDTALHTPHRGVPADVIPLQYHSQMLLDEHRMGAFEQAVEYVVRPGMHVLDLGAGTGVLSYFAARAGARVTAIEREPRVQITAQSALDRAVGDRVRVLHADAREYVPDEPVQVVLCEMMHVGLLRERQIEVIRGFLQRYQERFGGPPPRFIPEAGIQAVQPVRQDFTFHGYTVPVPLFQDAFADQPRTVQLAAPRVFQQFFYEVPLPDSCTGDLEFILERDGVVNAVRVITKNLLAVGPAGTVEWLMNYLVVPLREPVEAPAGSRVRVRFEYHPGDEISALMDTARAVVLG
jgi:type I protein arginine methyltransferase